MRVTRSATLRVAVDAHSTVDLDRMAKAVRSLLAHADQAADCSLLLRADECPARSLDRVLADFADMRFGVARKAPAVFVALPLDGTPAEIWDVVDAHNTVHGFLHVLTVVEHIDAPDRALLERTALLDVMHVDQSVILRLPSWEIPLLACTDALRRLRCLLFDGPSVTLHVQDSPGLSDVFLTDMAAAAGRLADYLADLPVLPPGPLDVLYCARRLSAAPWLVTGTDRSSMLMALCRAMRQGYWTCDGATGSLVRATSPTSLQMLARLMAEHPANDLVPMFGQASAARSAMADFVDRSHLDSLLGADREGQA